ncbi:PqqD family protein [Bacteroides sp. 519]|uniref:PqqD family protein n=1 Tax=Bacteroides sp. 519 TaxID=2302937 RepID=UPI0013D37733|nr:PqqD family protein [Bacteroides sp. 519]NDV60222.1 PqqD family protein [Bacteroides sp. 519]
MKIRKDFKMQTVGGEHIILLQGNLGVDTTKIISFNETSLFLWNLYQNKEFTKEQIATSLIEEYGIDEELATEDADMWVRSLIQHSLID